MIGFCIDLRPDFAFVSMLTVALRTIPNGALMKCNFRNADLNQMFCFGFIPWILIEPIVVVVLTTQLSDLSSTGSKGSDEYCLTGFRYETLSCPDQFISAVSMYSFSEVSASLVDLILLDHYEL